jgi:hypothetical protein
VDSEQRHARVLSAGIQQLDQRTLPMLGLDARLKHSGMTHKQYQSIWGYSKCPKQKIPNQL